jgi:hypothetical protein
MVTEELFPQKTVSIYQNAEFRNTENHSDVSVPLCTPQLLGGAYNNVQLQGLHPPPLKKTAKPQQMVQKAEVATEKAAVTLSRGFRREAHGSSGEGQK